MIVNTIADLKSAALPTENYANVLGYHSTGDGGGGEFYWDSTSTDNENGGTIFQKTGTATGRWKRIISGAFEVSWFGAKGDGATDDTTAFQAAASFLQTIPSPGFIHSHAVPKLNACSAHGYVITDTIYFKPPVGGRSICFNNTSQLFYNGVKDRPCIVFENYSNSDFTISVIGNSAVNASTDTSTGIIFRSVMWSNIKINIAARFKTLIVCEADGQLSQSFAWNNIWLNQMWGAIDYFVVSSVNNGWPNANLVYGGSFGYSSNDITGLNSNIMSFVKAISDGKYHSNAWTFYGCQFEGGSLANNSHIECINCSNSLIRGWRFRDIRYEAHDNTMRLGILCNTSDSYADVQVDFMFAIGDVNSNTLTFTNGCKNINTAADAFLLDTGSIANNLKKAGAIYLIKNMDSFHYRSNTGLFNSTTSFSSYFPMHLYKLDEQVSIRVYANGRIFFGICDENMNIITNNDGLLTSQIDNIVRTGITFTVINNCLIRSGGDAATSYQQVNILTIPTAKYIFFCHNTIDPDNAIKIQVQRLSFKKMHKISFKGRVRPNDAYWYFSGLPNTIVTNWEKEDKYYITSTDQLYRITKSGVGLQYSGLTVTGTSGTSTLTVNAGDMTKFIEGAEFTIAGDSTVYKIKSMDTTALTINVQTNLITSPTTATVTFIAAEYELVNYLKTGTTAQRPTTLTSTQFGALYYDTTIDKHVFWNGSAWVDYRTTSQANSTATDIATLQTDFNALLEKLKSAGLMS